MTTYDVLQENIKKCKGLPEYLKQFAVRLSKVDYYDEVRVHCINTEHLKFRHSHHKNKNKNQVFFETRMEQKSKKIHYDNS